MMEKAGGLEESTKEEEVASQSSERSRKSDVATNTETTAMLTAATVTAAVTAREQDPYRACRKLPLPRQGAYSVLPSFKGTVA